MTHPLTPEPSAPHDRPAIDPVLGSASAESLLAPAPPIPANRVYAYWLLTFFVIFTGSIVSLSWLGFKLFQTNAERINTVLADQRAEQAAFRQSLTSAQSELTGTQAQIQSEQSQVAQLRDEQHTSQNTLTQQISQIENKVAGIQDRLGRGEIAWQLADIGFLLTRAQERLSIAHDPAGAAIALKLADERIAALALPQLLPVRAALSEARAQLKQAEGLDRVGVALSLGRAAQTINAWPLAGSTRNQAPSDAPSPLAITRANPEVIRKLIRKGKHPRQPNKPRGISAGRAPHGSPWLIGSASNSPSPAVMSR